MDKSQQITAALKQFLKEKGFTYAMLAQKIRLSEASVKRLFSTSAFTLKRLVQFSDAEGIKLLAKLDRLKLIELMPNNRVRMLCPQRFAWRVDGPVRQKFQAAGMAEYLAGSFMPKTDLLRLEARELSHASMAIIKRKLERIAVEFNELAEIDSSLAISKRESVGMVLAIRPWVFSIVSALKRK